MLKSLTLNHLTIRANAVDSNNDEAEEGQNEGEIYGGVVHHRSEVNDGALEGWHDGAADNGHDEEGSTE